MSDALARLTSALSGRYRIERELGLRPVEENRQLVMVVNWIQELKRRTGGGK